MGPITIHDFEPRGPIAVAVERYANLGVVLNGQLSLIAMAFAAGVGIFFGFYPAWKASLLQPVEALLSD